MFGLARFKSKEIVPDVVTGFVPPKVKVEFGVLASTDVTVPLPPVPPIQLLLIAKQPPVAKLIPPVELNDEVAVLKLIPLVFPTDNIEPGDVVPIPKFPLSRRVNLSVLALSAKTRPRPVPVPLPVIASLALGVDEEIPTLPTPSIINRSLVPTAEEEEILNLPTSAKSVPIAQLVRAAPAFVTVEDAEKTS